MIKRYLKPHFKTNKSAILKSAKQEIKGQREFSPSLLDLVPPNPDPAKTQNDQHPSVTFINLVIRFRSSETKPNHIMLKSGLERKLM